jgi:hypothetical protein
MLCMDEDKSTYDDFRFLQGVDLTLWVQVLVSLLVISALGWAAAALA